ncbi:ethyl tert-butyl ether degradation protein EthD [Chromobacterium sphagni]|uniref:Ethyl tert-butyl ether degradation protein EthD n=1 Tax=Chromobacterium sphagni TaxID=1903179 RepID=A0A1S1WY66_9NEIS|nr:EthD family reductase [Chromobacterium sphagni]OHX12212.1 ethyl tert-butyl ether degradation protein EthD [Chromobacterium sphagni]
MIAVTVVYPNRAAARFDFDYYMQQHMPMVQQLLGSALKGVQVERGLSGLEPGSPPDSLAQAQLVFESPEAFQRAFAPVAARIMDDIANYTDIQPTIQFSEILLHEERKPSVSGWYASAG